jgi:hypothetical protein
MDQDFIIEDDSEIESIHKVYARIPKQISRELQREAHYYAQLLPRVLADIGIDHWIRKEARPTLPERLLQGKRSRQMIQFLEIAYHETNIYFRVDPLRLPYNITVADLKEENLLETLSAACGRRVDFVLQDYEAGAWFVLHRSGIISSIPKDFSFRDAINAIAPSAPTLKYCVGLGPNMKLITADLAALPHLLIAGASGMGKSVHLNSILLQMLWRNSPAKVQFLMVDLKGGMELMDYEGIPHLWGGKIITRIEDTVDALSAYKREMERRQSIMSGRARSLEQWNRFGHEKMPYLVLVIDEMAQVLRNPMRNISEEAKILLGGILAVSRSTGGHAILCTQRPSVDVVDGYIKTNIPARIAFGLPTQADSRVVLDTSDAAGIDIKGRGWMLLQANRVQLQAPWVSPNLIRRTIKAIKERDGKPIEQEQIDIVDLARTSLEKFDGKMSVRILFDEFRGRISKDNLQDILSQVDGEVITVDDNQYLVHPANGQGRRLERLDFECPASDDRQFTEDGVA